MKVLSEKQVTKIRINYDNTEQSNDRDDVFKYLDNRFGVLGYTVVRQGPSPDKFTVGLMIVEVDTNA